MGTSVRFSGKVNIKVGNEQVNLTYNSSCFDFRMETVEITDPRLSVVWGTKLERLSFTAKGQSLKGKYEFAIK